MTGESKEWFIPPPKKAQKKKEENTMALKEAAIKVTAFGNPSKRCRVPPP